MTEDNAVRVALADFADRRGEIDKRSREQQALIRLNITAAGVLAGLVVAEHGNPLLLLLLPPISSALGMLWANHNRMIHHIGDYIYNYVKPVVDPRRKGPLLHWEAAHDLYPGASRWQRGRYAFPVLIVFAGPAVAAVVFTAFEVVEKGGAWLLWCGWGAATILTAGAAVLVATSGIFARVGSGERRMRSTILAGSS